MLYSDFVRWAKVNLQSINLYFCYQKVFIYFYFNTTLWTSKKLQNIGKDIWNVFQNFLYTLIIGEFRGFSYFRLVLTVLSPPPFFPLLCCLVFNICNFSLKNIFEIILKTLAANKNNRHKIVNNRIFCCDWWNNGYLMKWSFLTDSLVQGG